MNERIYPPVATLLSCCGVCFSGYLSARRYFADSCAFDQTCVTFGGVPACYIGFGLFVTLLGISFAALRRNLKVDTAAMAAAAVASLGVTFAGYTAFGEFQAWWSGAGTYALGLPTCFYGASFFATMLVLSIATLGRRTFSRARQGQGKSSSTLGRGLDANEPAVLDKSRVN